MTGRVTFVSGTAWYLWNFRRNVIRAFVDRGWSVQAIAGPDDWSTELAAMPGVEVVDWPVSMDGSNPLKEFGVLRRVSSLLRQGKPNIVFNNGIKANVYGGIAARRLGIPYVNNVSGLGMRMRESDLKAQALARLYCYGCGRAEALLIQNPGDLTFLKRHGLPHVRTIRTMGSGVDLEHFAPLPMPPMPPCKLVFVGRLQGDKGIHDLVAAARLLKQKEAPVDLTVVGDRNHANNGAVEDHMLSAWKKDEIADFAGHQSDIRPYLAKAHALVMPSHGGEGMPKVMLEAAAMGRPVLASDVDGCRDAIVPGETGLLVPPRNSEALAEAIRAFCAIPEEARSAMGHAARAHAEAHFSDQTIVDICLDLAKAR